MRQNYEPKPLFIERMKKLLGEANYERYWKKVSEDSVRSIRTNTLKISPSNLKKRLEEKGWKITQPFKENQEIMFIESNLEPGELGRSLEHLLGYYYIQETASMLPAIALNPKKEDLVLDLCASPGSKTTQIASLMENEGLILANDILGTRIRPLKANLQRCGVKNCIITLMSGQSIKGKFDKILLDAPCSGTGAIRKSPETIQMWNNNMVKRFSKVQKSLILSAFDALKDDGTLVYSTCSIDPDENEKVIEFLLEKRSAKIENVDLNLKRSEVLSDNQDVKKCLRIWPQDNDTEGFFIAKIKK